MHIKTLVSRSILLLLFSFSYIIAAAQAPPVKQWDKTFGGNDDDEPYSLQPTTDGGYIMGGYSSSNRSSNKTDNSNGGYDYWIVKVDASGNKQWDKTFGGSGNDYLYSLQQTSDGGYILGGYSLSNSSGDKTENGKGNYDYWIVKVDASGNKQWDKTFGGSDGDYLVSLQQTSDGGYIAGGYSFSNSSGNKTDNSNGGYDYWIVKIDGSGNKQWDKTFGGSNGDYLYSLQQTSDGGYILGGYSISNSSGNKTANNNGNYDYWIVKVDGSGTKQWDKTFGGNDGDYLYSLQQTSDGGYILGGFSYSDSGGDKTADDKGEADYWIVKVDGSGTKQWDKTLGGNDEDELWSLQQTPDGGYILGGYSLSNSGRDKTDNSNGGYDNWIVKVDGSGTKQWDKTVGGSDNDFLFSIQQTTDGGYMIGGYSFSNNSGDKTENFVGTSSAPDFWNIKLCTPRTYYQDNDGDGFGNATVSTQSCTQPGGYVSNSLDCNDGSAAVNPNTPWYHDTDGDGFGNATDTVHSCTQPGGYVSNSTDCNDGDATMNPNTTWYHDADGDGFGNAADAIRSCTQPGGYVSNSLDCNDNSATVNPNTVWYHDADGDGYGNLTDTAHSCTQPTHYVADSTDCNDGNAAINPATLWVLDKDGDNYYTGSPVTQCTSPGTGYVIKTSQLLAGDCNDGDAAINPDIVWYHDADGDSYGNPSDTIHSCTQRSGYVSNSTDCNDANAAVNPNTVWYHDVDKDGYGSAADTIHSCTQRSGYVSNSTDCNDNNVAINPATVWVMNKDGDTYYTGSPVTQCTSPGTGYVIKTAQLLAGDCNDGNAAINPATVWYHDVDGDGYGNLTDTIHSCTQRTGYVSNSTDCNDGNAAIKPTTVWVMNKDGDTYYTGSPVTQCTSPGTGYVIKTSQLLSGDCNDSDKTVYPGAPELCDGKDNNCNGTIDENCPVLKLSINSVSMNEGNSGQTQMKFTVSLNSPAYRTITVKYATADGTAKAPGDYVATSGTLTFTSGTQSMTITVLINGDKVREPKETFSVKLSNAVNATLLSSTGTGTILNDD